MQDMPATNEREPTGRISVLEDTNDDGKMDKKTVFLDKLVLPRALKVLDRGVLVAEPPQPLAGARHQRRPARRHEGAGHRQLRPGRRPTSSTTPTGCCGRSTTGCTPRKGHAPAAEGRQVRGAQDAVARPVGRLAGRRRPRLPQHELGGAVRRPRADALLRAQPEPDAHPRQLRVRSTTGDLNTVWPVRPTPGVNRGYQDGVLRADGTLAAFTAVGAPTVYRGDRLPAELYGNVFVAEPAGNLVSRIIVTDDGTTLRGQEGVRARRVPRLDRRAVPAGVSVVGARRHALRRRHVSRHHPAQGLHHRVPARSDPVAQARSGRRATAASTGSCTTRRSATPTGAVDDDGGRSSSTCSRIRTAGGGTRRSGCSSSAAASVGDSGAEGARRDARRTGGRGCTRCGRSTASTPSSRRRSRKALDDPSRDVRVVGGAACRALAGRREAPDPGGGAEAARRHGLGGAPSARGLAWARCRSAAKIPALATLLERHGDDPVTVDAAFSGLRGSEARRPRSGCCSATEPDAATNRRSRRRWPRRSCAAAKTPAVQELFQSAAARGRPAWQRMRCSKAPRRRCSAGRCPALAAAGPAADAAPPQRRQRRSARADARGPGGAPAFPSTPASADAPAGRRPRPRQPRRAVPLTRRAGGAHAARRSRRRDRQARGRLLARLTWPGKPVEAGAAPPAAPLTPDEQKRFDAGKAVYTSLCVACHQENGQGRDKVAPALVGSNFALAAPHVPERILINGKEGPVGLMPPLGSVLSDDQIAGGPDLRAPRRGATRARRWMPPVSPTSASRRPGARGRGPRKSCWRSLESSPPIRPSA